MCGCSKPYMGQTFLIHLVPYRYVEFTIKRLNTSSVPSFWFLMAKSSLFAWSLIARFYCMKLLFIQEYAGGASLLASTQRFIINVNINVRASTPRRWRAHRVRHT